MTGVERRLKAARAARDVERNRPEEEGRVLRALWRYEALTFAELLSSTDLSKAALYRAVVVLGLQKKIGRVKISKRQVYFISRKARPYLGTLRFSIENLGKAFEELGDVMSGDREPRD